MRLGKHIAVVGAGVVGLAVAVRLRREGYRVTLFDPGEPGGQASAGNAGLIMTAQTGAASVPGLWRRLPGMFTDKSGPLVVRGSHVPRLTPWLMRFLGNSRRGRYEAIADVLAPMVTRSLDAWLALVNTHESGRLFRQDGLLYVYRERRNFAAAKKEALARARYDIPSEVIPGEELHQMEPALGSDLAGGVFYPASAHCVDPQALSASLISAFRTGGGEVKRTTVRELNAAAGGIKLVMDDGEITFDEVVVAAGIWSSPLVKPFGVRNMLAAERGYHLMLHHPGIEVRRPVIAGDHRFVITPMSKGIRLAGTAEFASVNAAPDWNRADMLLPLAQRIMPELNGAETATRWMGSRPSTPDSLPLVGRAPKNPRVICAFGHAHLGLTLGAVTAGQVADIIARRAHEIPADALDPSRF